MTSRILFWANWCMNVLLNEVGGGIDLESKIVTLVLQYGESVALVGFPIETSYEQPNTNILGSSRSFGLQR